jgi:cyclophilin family peptidyl-prolyl cis-trans isomerase
MDSASAMRNTFFLSSKYAQHFVLSFFLRNLFKRFGPGPHHVEVEVNFPTHQEENWYFTIELAPIDEMPHSIHTFLELVSRGLFDNGGYSFYSNAVHVIQGGPFSNHLTGSDIGNVEERFQESGYASVLFQEYSESFPHEKYTLGFTGRPGGPSFYINTRDNTQDHGPGGYAADGKGDPCFGKVIHGFDVVDKMHQASGEIIDGEWKHTDGGSIAVRSMKYMQ